MGISTEKEKEKEKKKSRKGKGREREDEDDVPLEKFKNILLKIPEWSEVSAKDTEEWMMCYLSDLGYQILNDDELIESGR